MLAPVRAIRNSTSPLATMASIVSLDNNSAEDPIRTPQANPTRLVGIGEQQRQEGHHQLEHMGMQPGHSSSNHFSAVTLELALLVHYGSSLAHWEGRLLGSCR